MVIARAGKERGRQAWLSLDLGIAISLLLIALLPLAFSFSYEQKLCRIYYFQAVAMEIVDGEFEILRAGAWKEQPLGTHEYEVKAGAATNLPPGKFLLTIEDRWLRLEWRAEKRGKGGRVVREGAI